MLSRIFLTAHPTPRLSDEECAQLEAAIARTVNFDARSIIVRENQPLTNCTLLLAGIAYRYKDTEEGKRQILALHYPGDFVDLHSYPLKRLEHTVGALTAVQMAVVPHDAICRLTETSSRLTELLWKSTLVDAAMNREWLTSVGARAGVARVAHLFCEAYVRLRMIGGTRGWTFDFPLTQLDLGEATGLTSVHANRMLRRLREPGILTFRNGVASIGDWQKLCEIAEFDDNYLFLD
ncbi:Crp/Fnr family transcriptional regulator [Flavisphingomonas formosensis]|uniref:Crp/Fnr family transcriptional regulator n=1 Tax=Flavisphingomonas formosensis TaxID=861534 RepID=UPI0012F774BF|nr:Crp/Fnr family transcriptional regulator [Sphingomonas formosensis]